VCVHVVILSSFLPRPDLVMSARSGHGDMTNQTNLADAHASTG
jgi:hypothetical protein